MIKLTKRELKFHKRTDSTVLNFLHEANLPLTTVQLECFQNLCYHLNPLVRIPELCEINGSSHCFVCWEPTTFSDWIELTAADNVAKILLVLVHYKHLDRGAAIRLFARGQFVYKMCKEHLHPVYNYMIRLQREVVAHSRSCLVGAPPGIEFLRELKDSRNAYKIEPNIRVPTLNLYRLLYFKKFCDTFKVMIGTEKNEKIPAPPPPPICFICNLSDPRKRFIELNGIFKVLKVLLPLVHFGEIGIEQAKKAIACKEHTMCMEHLFPVYQLMLELKYQIDCAFGRERSTPGYKILHILEETRDKMLGTKAYCTDIKNYRTVFFKYFFEHFTPMLTPQQRATLAVQIGTLRRDILKFEIGDRYGALFGEDVKAEQNGVEEDENEENEEDVDFKPDFSQI
ncbi:unnamed protein product [Caenorhabditis sp. 36 PRJEB53466]|nr:unnamed protein product [Caenorhabditis sp. 36 PRJEB53466]